MIKSSMVFGTVALVAVGAFASLERGGDSVAPQAMQVPPEALQVTPQMTPMPELAQDNGTTCQTADGTVCTVSPRPIRSRCQCGESYGSVVR